MFDFLAKVMCFVWIWASGLKLPTHTAQIHKSLSWLAEGHAAVSISLVQVKKKLRWWRNRTDNDYFLLLSNLSKGPLHLDVDPLTWMDFDIFMRKARLLQSQGTVIWYQPLTYSTRFRAMAGFTHPLRISRFILFHKISGRATNYMWHHIVNDFEQNSSMEGGMGKRKVRMKESTRMSQWVYCGFFQDPTCPIVVRNQPCLPVYVW